MDETLKDRLRRDTGNLRQLASVRSLTLQDGAEGGQRATAFSTGSGLDLWLLPDRSMDIGPLWWRGMPLAWQHPNGIVPATRHDPYADSGTGMERALSGFLVTCGYDSVRQAHGGLPLHGSHTLTPARITRQYEDWDAPVPTLICEGEWTCAHLSGPSYRINRRVEAPVMGRGFRIRDRVENIGLERAPFDTLYHVNLGYPAVHGDMDLSVGTDKVCLKLFDGRAHYSSKPVVSCYSSGDAERLVARFRRASSDLFPALDMSLTVECDELPYFQVWMDPRPGRRILALEPASSARTEEGRSRSVGMMEPGEIKTLSLAFEFNTD